MAPHTPVPIRRRSFIEGMIRVIDLGVYGATTIAGLYAVVATPGAIEEGLGQESLLIWLWGGLLLIGGLVGFLGRLARRWMVEAPATILALAGMLIYFAVLARVAFTSVTFMVGAIFAAIASVLMIRRWAELQLFATNGKDVKSQWKAALARKTSDFPRHT